MDHLLYWLLSLLVVLPSPVLLVLPLILGTLCFAAGYWLGSRHSCQ